MLDKICDVCSNVLLQKPMNLGGEQFCVSCTDLAPRGDASRDLPTQTSTTQIETGTKPVSKAKVKVVQATVNAVKPKIKSETEIIQSKSEENSNQSEHSHQHLQSIKYQNPHHPLRVFISNQYPVHH